MVLTIVVAVMVLALIFAYQYDTVTHR